METSEPQPSDAEVVGGVDARTCGRQARERLVECRGWQGLYPEIGSKTTTRHRAAAPVVSTAAATRTRLCKCPGGKSRFCCLGDKSDRPSSLVQLGRETVGGHAQNAIRTRDLLLGKDQIAGGLFSAVSAYSGRKLSPGQVTGLTSVRRC
jgi:hypothetical protein